MQYHPQGRELLTGPGGRSRRRDWRPVRIVSTSVSSEVALMLHMAAQERGLTLNGFLADLIESWAALQRSTDTLEV